MDSVYVNIDIYAKIDICSLLNNIINVFKL